MHSATFALRNAFKKNQKTYIFLLISVDNFFHCFSMTSAIALHNPLGIIHAVQTALGVPSSKDTDAPAVSSNTIIVKTYLQDIYCVDTSCSECKTSEFMIEDMHEGVMVCQQCGL